MSDFPEQQKSVKIYGVVTEVERATRTNGTWSKTKFKVKTIIETKKKGNKVIKEERTYRVNSHINFCRVEAEDVVFVKGIETISKVNGIKNYYLDIYEAPIVEPATTKSSILNLFTRALARKGRLANSGASNIYSAIVEHTKGMDKYSKIKAADRVNLFMVELSNFAAKSKGDIGESELAPINDVVSSEEAKALIRYWFSHRERRKLQMVGIRDDIIDEILDNNIYTTDILYDKVRKNPYTVPNIPMDLCFNIMKKFKMSPVESQLRCGEILRYLYRNTKSAKWTCTPVDWAEKYYPDIYDYIDILTAPTDPEGETKGGYGVVKVEMRGKIFLYLKHCEEVERELSDKLSKFVTEHRESKYQDDFETMYTRDDLTEDQKEAITGAINNPISVITGGGGTGKTTIIIEVIHNFNVHNIHYAICSFTGKAVARIREVLSFADYTESEIGNLTFTLHRGLHSKNEDVDDVTHLIIDETSMVTTGLINQFLDRYPTIKWLTLVGDCNQLPPIESGSFFKEVIESNCCPVYRLTHKHRIYEAEVSGIAEITKAIEDYDGTKRIRFKDRMDFRVYNSKGKSGMKEVQRLIKTIHSNDDDSDDDSDDEIRDDDISVVCPFKNEKNALNNVLQKYYVLHARKKHKINRKSVTDSDGNVWFVGDRIVMKKNNYDVEVMNGDEGRIIDINGKDIRIGFSKESIKKWKEGCDINTKQFSDTKKRSFIFSPNIPKDDPYGGERHEKRKDGPTLHMGMVELAYCLTVHKSQGSEWNYVIFYVPERAQASRGFLNRNLMYTGISRGKGFVALVGEAATMKKAVNTRPSYRWENLAQRLRELLPEEFEKYAIEVVECPDEFVPDDFDYSGFDLGVYDDFDMGAAMEAYYD